MLTDDLSRVSACKYYNPKTDKVLEQVFFNEHGNVESIYKRIGDTNFVHNYTTKFCDVEKGLVNPLVPGNLELSHRYEYIMFNNDNSVKHIEKFNPVTQDLINDITYQPLF